MPRETSYLPGSSTAGASVDLPDYFFAGIVLPVSLTQQGRAALAEIVTRYATLCRAEENAAPVDLATDRLDALRTAAIALRDLLVQTGGSAAEIEARHFVEERIDVQGGPTLADLGTALDAFLFTASRAGIEQPATRHWRPTEAREALVNELAGFYQHVTGQKPSVSSAEDRANSFSRFVFSVHQMMEDAAADPAAMDGGFPQKVRRAFGVLRKSA